MRQQRLTLPRHAAGRDLQKASPAGRASLLERLQAFQVDLARPAPGQVPAFPLLVHKLQDALSATEDLPVHSTGPASSAYSRFSDALSGGHVLACCPSESELTVW